jgi:hypothetical protein
MKIIYILTDYKDNFGSKWQSEPYRGGFDKKLLNDLFFGHGFKTVFIRFSDVNFRTIDWSGKIIIYTSSEDNGSVYKSYIEDIVLGLELCGAHVIPGYKYLRAHDNKVMMELLKQICLKELIVNEGNDTLLFGCLEELKYSIDNNNIQYPCVIKTSSGSMSKGVSRADNDINLLKIAKHISSTFNFRLLLKDLMRELAHPGYKMESTNRKKFIVQPMIEELKNDWKVLVYDDYVYVLKRCIRDNDFRASGSHYNYKSGSESGITIELLNFARAIFKKLDVPFLSLDLASKNGIPYLIEFQTIYFGTSTHYMSKDCYLYKNDDWDVIPNVLNQEEIFVQSIVRYCEIHEGLICE